MAIRSLFATFRRLNAPSLLLMEEMSGISRPLSSSSLTTDDLEESKDTDLKSMIFMLKLPKLSATAVLQKWVTEGNKLNISELRHLAEELRKLRRYKHALEISEWMVSHQEFELSNSDHAVRIELITKVFGVYPAECYFEGLPLTAKTGETYTSLLHSYAGAKLTESAESLFERIKESNITLNALAYNEMMTLYTSVGQLDKVLLVIEELKRRKVSPDLFTYNLWISACAATLDIDSVQRILDEMTHDSNSNEGWVTYKQLTNIYINLEDNSLAEAKKNITQREWVIYDFLIILYTGLRNKGRLDQIWNSLKKSSQKMTSSSYLCILSSYLMLGQFSEAGEVLDELKQSNTADFNAHTFGGCPNSKTWEIIIELWVKERWDEAVTAMKNWHPSPTIIGKSFPDLVKMMKDEIGMDEEASAHKCLS